MFAAGIADDDDNKKGIKDNCPKQVYKMQLTPLLFLLLNFHVVICFQGIGQK